ncbi:MAG: hypothetical protein QOE77_586 [Blastocatellia bacterium]|jgi:uncharacterized damage-inducible protein DinB|nr:hypothetical protein [Blastocatellia bacterium]
MNEIGSVFVLKARDLLTNDYLPKIERCLERLTDEQVWWRPNEESNSIGNLVLHLCGNARQWIVCGVGGGRDQRDRSQEFAERSLISRQDLHNNLKQTIVDVDQTLAEFDLSKLLESRAIQGCDVSNHDAIFHVVEHFSMHTGQIILLTKLLTESDLGFYDFSAGVPGANWRA